MRKLHLDLDALDVDSFAADGSEARARGTVRGAEYFTGNCPTGSYFTLGQASCYGECRTHEYDTCYEAGPSVGPSCDYLCQEPSLGC